MKPYVARHAQIQNLNTCQRKPSKELRVQRKDKFQKLVGEIFKRKEPFKVFQINDRDPFKRKHDHSKPLDMGKLHGV